MVPQSYNEKGQVGGKKYLKKQRRGSGVLDCVKFHSNRSRRISGCTHAQSEQLQGGDARHQRAWADAILSRGSQKFRTFHFYATPCRPRVPYPRFIFRHFIFFSSVDITLRRLTRSPTRDSRACIDDDECIVHCVPYVHIRAHVATRSRGSSRVWITR